MGALGLRTSLRFGTAVTCPGFRYHPAVIAHAAATLGAMFPGRFWLGLGAGEALNEHIIGGEWPEIGVRSAMMFESIEIIAELFSGKVVKHRGQHFKLESAKLYTRPERAGPDLRRDVRPDQREEDRQVRRGMITVGAADEKVKLLWRRATRAAPRPARPDGPEAAPAPPQLGEDRRGGPPERAAGVAERRNVVPEAGHQEPGGLRGHGEARPAGGFQEPGADHVGSRAHTAHVQHYLDMGFDEIHLHNVGRNQAEFIEVFGREVLPNLRL